MKLATLSAAAFLLAAPVAADHGLHHWESGNWVIRRMPDIPACRLELRVWDATFYVDDSVSEGAFLGLHTGFTGQIVAQGELDPTLFIDEYPYNLDYSANGPALHLTVPPAQKAEIFERLASGSTVGIAVEDGFISGVTYSLAGSRQALAALTACVQGL